MNDNKKILDQVKNAVSSKNSNEKKQGSAKTFSENETQEKDNEINDWIQKNAERIAKEIIQKEIKKIFK